MVKRLSIVLLLGACCGGMDLRADSRDVKISVFADFVRSVANERQVSLEKAASLLYGIGVRGIDVNPDDKDLERLVATKLTPVNFYVFPDIYGVDNGASDCKRYLEKALLMKVPRMMVVPPHFTGKEAENVELTRCVTGIRRFVEEGRKVGITITVEDFGFRANPGSHMKNLRLFLDEIPGLKFALDSGNLYYADRGEDIVEMLKYAKGRIVHVHLKDQDERNHQQYVSLGLGGVPNEQLVRSLAANGYDGWYTLECTVVGKDTLTDTVRQVAVLKHWLGCDEAKCSD